MARHPIDIEIRGTYTPIPGAAPVGDLLTIPVPVYRAYRQRTGKRGNQRRVPDVVDMSGYGFPRAYDPMVVYNGSRHVDRHNQKRLKCGKAGKWQL